MDGGRLAQCYSGIVLMPECTTMRSCIPEVNQVNGLWTARRWKVSCSLTEVTPGESYKLRGAQQKIDPWTSRLTCVDKQKWPGLTPKMCRQLCYRSRRSRGRCRRYCIYNSGFHWLAWQAASPSSGNLASCRWHGASRGALWAAQTMWAFADSDEKQTNGRLVFTAPL